MTTQKDWQGYYSQRNSTYRSIPLEDFRFFPHKQLLDAVQQYFNGGAFLEVGAGDSSVLIDAALYFSPEKCVGLDYLKDACTKLKDKAKQAKVEIQTVCADVFSPPVELQKKFGFVLSFGLVEHFKDINAVVQAIALFAKKNGIVFTVIPNNKKTIYGYLMKKWNEDVYNAHVMYDLDDLKQAHASAGLEILFADYLVSSNFGMLSWCFVDRPIGINYWLYKQLTRVSKLFWYFESRFRPIKPVPNFAPYILCVARVKQ